MRKPSQKTSPQSRSSSDQSGSGEPGSSRSEQRPITNKKEAERRQTQVSLRTFRYGARLAKRARLSAFHCGSRQGRQLVPKAQRQANASCDSGGAHDPMDRQPGRRSYASPRALPAPSCLSPASTSRTGRSAGRMMPKPPGGKGDEPLPAGTATRSANRCQAAGVLHGEREAGAFIRRAGRVSFVAMR